MTKISLPFVRDTICRTNKYQASTIVCRQKIDGPIWKFWEARANEEKDAKYIGDLNKTWLHAMTKQCPHVLEQYKTELQDDSKSGSRCGSSTAWEGGQVVIILKCEVSYVGRY